MVGESGAGRTADGFPPASLLRRFAALFVDWILCLLVSATFANPFRQAWAPVAVLILEYTFFIGLFAQTPGMLVARIRCVGVADGQPVGPPRAFVRGLLLALFIPALIMDAQQRGLHDRAAATIVTPTR